MNPELQQLKDIHLPKAIHGWLIAPGWLFLYTVLIVSTTYLIYIGYQRRQRNKVVTYALSKLKTLENFITENPENINIAA